MSIVDSNNGAFIDIMLQTSDLWLHSSTVNGFIAESSQRVQRVWRRLSLATQQLAQHNHKNVMQKENAFDAFQPIQKPLIFFFKNISMMFKR